VYLRGKGLGHVEGEDLGLLGWCRRALEDKGIRSASTLASKVVRSMFKAEPLAESEAIFSELLDARTSK
jgi:hypothetical protein